VRLRFPFVDAAQKRKRLKRRKGKGLRGRAHLFRLPAGEGGKIEKGKRGGKEKKEYSEPGFHSPFSSRRKEGKILQKGKRERKKKKKKRGRKCDVMRIVSCSFTLRFAMLSSSGKKEEEGGGTTGKREKRGKKRKGGGVMRSPRHFCLISIARVWGKVKGKK